ncbi:hypothetical protein D920_02114 [Enterococcus faecalis 13-SD-W-01]|nr:hypothetical protein D920_02114 [Enterococcus faecalis 13-SD-W-01]
MAFFSRNSEKTIVSFPSFFVVFRQLFFLFQAGFLQKLDGFFIIQLALFIFYGLLYTFIIGGMAWLREF